MDEARILPTLDEAESAVSLGDGLSGTGFWKAVGEVKRDPELARRLANRIAGIDRQAFEKWALLTVPVGTGTVLAGLATAVGVAGVTAAYYTDPPWNWLVLGASTTLLLVTTHGLAHLVVGRASGMRFTHWFIGTLSQPQPGVKVDYATYLQTSPRRRAWMHASGALMTKLIPFLVLPVAITAGLPTWTMWLLVVLGVVEIITDVVWSTKASDWKKFRREMRYVV